MKNIKTKEEATQAFENGDISPAEYVNLPRNLKNSYTLDKALCAYKPQGTTPLDALAKRTNRTDNQQINKLL